MTLANKNELRRRTGGMTRTIALRAVLLSTFWCALAVSLWLLPPASYRFSLAGLAGFLAFFPVAVGQGRRTGGGNGLAPAL